MTILAVYVYWIAVLIGALAIGVLVAPTIYLFVKK